MVRKPALVEAKSAADAAQAVFEVRGSETRGIRGSFRLTTVAFQGKMTYI